MKKPILLPLTLGLLTFLPVPGSAQYAAFPTLQVRQTNSNVIISWEATPTFVLQAATNLTGPWVVVTNASNPLIMPSSLAARFFRLCGASYAIYPPRIDVPLPTSRTL